MDSGTTGIYAGSIAELNARKVYEDFTSTDYLIGTMMRSLGHGYQV